MNTAASPARQRGATLIAGLILLVVLMLLALTAVDTSTLELRMAGSQRDRDRAFQAAEAALRDAETYVYNQINGLTGFDAACTGGLCYNGPGGFPTPVWQNTSLFTNSGTSIEYGQHTGAGDISGLASDPRYIIEGFHKAPSGSSGSYYYRITVLARGASSDTQVMLQEVYKPRP